MFWRIILQSSLCLLLMTGLTNSSTETEIKDLKFQLQALKVENTKQGELLNATHTLLAQTLKALTGDGGRQSNHSITKRSTEDDKPDDILSSLSLHDMIPLLSTRCRDGRDGKDGKDGKDGIGINGKDGKDGRDGRDGLPGEDGEDGQPGPKGATGAQGAPGAASPPGTGTQGLPGTPGERGASGLAGQKGEPGSPGTSVEAGSTYIRWGRISCNGDATLVYHGLAAGGYYDYTGNGVNFQCLHRDPEYNAFNTASGTYSYIYGGEYQTYHYGIFPNSAYNQNIPCAQCYVPRSATMMIPSRRSCPQGWNKEYEGYLMAAYSGHKHPSTYECVDENPEYIAGQHAGTNGANLHFVLPDCAEAGTIGHCPPYARNKQLTCVVCSK